MTQTVFSVDWLTLTVWADNQVRDDVLSILGYSQRVLEPSSNGGGRGFRKLSLGDYGFRLYEIPVSESKDGGLDYWTIDLPGQSCAWVGLEKIIDAMSVVMDRADRWRCTRIDVAFDTQAFTVEQFWDVVGAAEGDFKTYVHRDNIEQWHSASGSGNTVYMGAAGSLSRLRVYKKQIEDSEVFGQEYFTRAELVVRRDRASALLVKLMYLPLEDWAETCMGFLRGFVDLGAEWWQTWLQGVDQFRISFQQPTPTIDKIQGWLVHQVAPSLAAWVKARHPDGEKDSILSDVLALFREGVSRHMRKHIGIIENYRRYVQSGLSYG